MTWLKFFFILIAWVGTSSPQQEKKPTGPAALEEVPITSFSCRHRDPGYYADIEASCQSYHMCDGVRQYSYLCPHKTVFHQKFMVCDHFLAVDCSGSEKYYGLNAENGEKNQQPSVSKPTNSPKKKMTSKISPPTRKPQTSGFFNTAKPLSKTTSALRSISSPTTRPFSKPTPSLQAFTFKDPVIPSDIISDSSIPIIETPLLRSTPNETPLHLSSRKANFQTPLKPLVPGAIVGRRAGKVHFGNIAATTTTIRPQVNLRPLVVRSSHFDRRSFTVPPPLATTPVPPPATIPHKKKLRSFQSFSSSSVRIPPVQPLKSSPVQIPRFLVPPPEGPVLIEGLNQEKHTPLSVSGIKPITRTPHLSPLRGHRAFFIPSSGLVPPLSQVENEIIPLSRDNHKMTMTFRSRADSRNLRLRVNPSCPRCHPAFLRPNECQPCVIIR